MLALKVGDEAEHARIVEWIDEQSRARGYADWIDAFHHEPAR